MKKILSAALAFWLCAMSVQAQQNTPPPSTPTPPASTEKTAPTAPPQRKGSSKASTSKTARIKNVDAVYDVRIGAFRQPLQDKAFDNLKDLGLLKVVTHEDGLQVVYLGSYMGKSAAEKTLSSVRRRGYDSAYLQRAKTEFVNVDGYALTHTYQFCSVKKLDLRRLGNALASDVSLLDKLFISFDGSYYQLSLGLLAPEMTEEIERYRAFAASQGFADGFLRTFHPAPQGYTPPAPKPAPAPPAPAKVDPPKPAPGNNTAGKNDKMNNATTGGNTNVSGKTDKMSGGTGSTNTDGKTNKMNTGKTN